LCRVCAQGGSPIDNQARSPVPASEDLPGQVSETRKRVGMALGIAVFVLMLVLPPPEGLEPAPWRAAAVAVLLAIFWLTEALPISATALLPLVLFPTLGITPIDAAAAF
jgi:di/tricarboxylate transporter